MPVRDFQRMRVYRWEAQAVMPLDPRVLDITSCRELVREAYDWADATGLDAHGGAPPRVTDGRGRRHACGSREVIKLPRWARTRPVILHECAHGLANDKHGPRFVRAYVDLLVHFMTLDRLTLITSLRAANIKVSDRST